MKPMKPENSFSSTLPVMVYHRTQDSTVADWRELDFGPGVFHIPAEDLVMVRIKNIDDFVMKSLIAEITDCPAITFLNLSENRKITNKSMELISTLTNLTGLNLSSCSITDVGLVHLLPLTRLEHLDLSYCNRLSDSAFKELRNLRSLTYLDLQGCTKITTGGIARFNRRGLVIHRGPSGMRDKDGVYR
jgi:hypothetical protein